MDFTKFTLLSVLFSFCSILQAFDSNSGIYVNHERWLEYSRALSSSLNNGGQILSLNEPRDFLKGNAAPCTGTDCGASSNGARGAGGLNADDAETPMSLLYLNVTDIEIPFKIVKDVLRLDAQDERKIKFVIEKAVVFSFVNKTVLRSIKESGKVEPKDDAMIIALFLPVEYHLSKCEGKQLSGCLKTMPTLGTVKENLGGKESDEWPTFFKTLLTEMAAANVTSQNLMDAILNSRREDTQSNSNDSDFDDDSEADDETNYSEASRLAKEHDFQATDVTLYFFRTPHIAVPQKYVKQVLKEVDIPLASSSQSKFEVNEVYLMTVANETAGKELKDKLKSGKWHGSHAPKSTPIVLSFIIPIEFNSERHGRSSFPRAKLTKSSPLFFVDSPSIINDPAPAHAFSHRTPLNLAPEFSQASFRSIPMVPVPLLVPYQSAEHTPQYFNNLKGNEEDHPMRYSADSVSMQDNYDDVRAGGKAEGHGSTRQGNREPPAAAPPAYAGPPDQQQAPPATAPGGITSALQP